jgi:uncharacterized protein with gpF-like domain
MKATEIASALKETFTGWKESRGKLIAITETTLASNTGGLEVFRAAGVKEKQWVTQLDTSVRHTHKNAHGQTKNLDEKFEVGGHSLAYPGDPDGPEIETVNCRCRVAPVRGED